MYTKACYNESTRIGKGVEPHIKVVTAGGVAGDGFRFHNAVTNDHALTESAGFPIKLQMQPHPYAAA